jgi:hypothetical protein
MIAVALNELLDKPQFGHGLALGIVFGVCGLVVGILWESGWHRPAPIAGVILTAAFVFATHGSTALPSNVKWGLVLLAAAGIGADFIASLWPPLVVLGAGFALPGASLMTTNTLLPSPNWVNTLVVVTVTVGGTLVVDFDRRHRDRGWAPMLIAVSALGVYYTVPDTERAMVLLGAALPLVLLGWPFPLASLGAVGAYPSVGALAWVAASDGRGRLTAIVGGVACLGLLVAEPIARLVRQDARGVIDALPREPLSAIVLGAGQLVLVFGASRVVGMRPVVRDAALLAVMELTAAVVILAFFAADEREDAPDDG